LAKASPPLCPALSNSLLVRPCLHPHRSKVGVGPYVRIFNMILVFCMAIGGQVGDEQRCLTAMAKAWV
jgi:hypothetical protein